MLAMVPTSTLYIDNRTSFEKDQKKYDKLFEYEAKKVVQGVPRLSKEAVALLEVMQPTL